MAEEKNSRQSDSRENKKVIMNFNGKDIEAAIDETGCIILPEEIQNMLAAGVNVIQHTTKETENEIVDNEPAPGNDVADKFSGLPMFNLVAAPLIAAAEAQNKLASTANDSYFQIAYEINDNGIPMGKERLLKIKLDKPLVEGGVVGGVSELILEIPYIGLVPIPTLSIDEIDIVFKKGVTEKSNSTEEASTNV